MIYKIILLPGRKLSPWFRDDLSDLLGNGPSVGDLRHEFRGEFDADGRRLPAHSHAREGGDLDAIRHPADEISQDDPVSSRVRSNVHVETRLVGQAVDLGEETAGWIWENVKYQ